MGDMSHERNVVCDMNRHDCNVMDGNTFATGENKNKCLSLIRSKNKGFGDPRSCVPSIVLMGAVQYVWTIVTVENGCLTLGRKRTVAFVLTYIASSFVGLAWSRPFLEKQSVLVPFWRFVVAMLIDERQE